MKYNVTKNGEVVKKNIYKKYYQYNKIGEYEQR